MASLPCGSVFFNNLPEDVLTSISAHLFPPDLCNLSFSCRLLYSAVSSSEKIWHSQCRRLNLHLPLPRWRAGVRSYKALCRFIRSVSPLLGLWVHQNPELGNVVYVLWGFLSVVGCRIVPQEVSPLGLFAGPLLWAPVFEIFAGVDGSSEAFYLHGREANDSIYPGIVHSIHPDCNPLLLETRVSRASPVTFSKLAFDDRRRLLDLVARRVRLNVPKDLLDAPLFLSSSISFQYQQDLLEDRRSALIMMHEFNMSSVDWRGDEFNSDDSENKNFDGDVVFSPTSVSNGGKSMNIFSVGGYLRNRFINLISKTRSSNISPALIDGSSGIASESRHAHLHYRTQFICYEYENYLYNLANYE